MRRAGRHALAGLLALLVAACAGDAQHYLPLDPGWWWYYEAVSEVRGERLTERVHVANERRDGDLVVQRYQGERREKLRVTEVGIEHLVIEPKQPPRAALLFPRAPAVGRTWSIEGTLRLVESRTFAPEDQLRGRRLPLKLDGRVITLDETVATPAGTFRDCLQVEFTGTRKVRADRGTLLVEVRVRHVLWYAPGVGLVKARREERTGSAFLRDGYYTQTLRAYGSP